MHRQKKEPSPLLVSWRMRNQPIFTKLSTWRVWFTAVDGGGVSHSFQNNGFDEEVIVQIKEQTAWVNSEHMAAASAGDDAEY